MNASKFIADIEAKVAGLGLGGWVQAMTQTEADLAYDAYIADVQTFNLVIANRQPEMDIDFHEWPDLQAEPSIQCVVAYMLALGAYVKMATNCVQVNYPNETATQGCVDNWFNLCTGAISGCVAQS